MSPGQIQTARGAVRAEIKRCLAHIDAHPERLYATRRRIVRLRHCLAALESPIETWTGTPIITRRQHERG